MKEQTASVDSNKANDNIKSQIRESLLKVSNYITEDNLFYGLKTGDEKSTWNYIVFGKHKFKRVKTAVSYLDIYYVDIIMENYIPDDMVISIIEELEKINGVKMCEEDCYIEYVDKTADVICEMCRIMFAAPKKKLNNA